MQPKVQFFFPCLDILPRSDGSGHDIFGIYSRLNFKSLPSSTPINVVYGIQFLPPHMESQFEVASSMDQLHLGRWSGISIRSSDYYSSAVVRLIADPFYVPAIGIVRFDAFLNGELLDSHYLEIHAEEGV